MVSRTISVLLAACVTSMLSQTPATVKARDPAPDLKWTRILASATASGRPPSFVGFTTVLLFLPPVSVNKQAVSDWNKMVEGFADKPVQFIWIANEKEESLIPFLKDQPVRGWLVLDAQEESYKAYGIEGGAGVLIDPRGLIAGFTSMLPQSDQIQAVLEGRAIAIKGEATDAQLDAFFEGKAVRLEAEPERAPPPGTEKPAFPPSDEVHISPSQTEGTISDTGPDRWIRRGFDLRTILSEIMSTTPSRIDLPAALDNSTRYDVAFVPPREEDEETMKRRLQEGMQKYFHVTITPAIRRMDVYVMTATPGKTPPARKPDDYTSIGGFTFSTEWKEFKPPEGRAATRKAMEEAARQAMETPEFRQHIALAEMAVTGAASGSIDEFCRALDKGLRRPIVDETRLEGDDYDFRVEGDARSTEEFVSMLRDQLGLILTPARRDIDAIVVRPVQ